MSVPHNKPGRHSGANERNVGTFVALGMILVLAGGLIVMMAIVIPAMLALALLPLVFLFLGAFHYLAWGWWMPAALTEEEQLEMRRGEAER